MKYIIAIGFLIICACDYASADCNKIYATVGTGYKFHESTSFIDEIGDKYYFEGVSKYSARLELGVVCNENLRFGVSHHSQWADGFPFDKAGEPYKTEFFVDYTYYWDI